MKKCLFLLLLRCLHVSDSLFSQNLEFLGLAEKQISALNVNYNVIAVGTDGSGVYWRNDTYHSDSTWNHIPLDSLTVLTVYPHKSGPIGWAIGAGVIPGRDDSVFVYCSRMGGDFLPISTGISSEKTDAVLKLDGYPDPTICGETYAAGGRALYRRYFADTVWTPVYQTTEMESLITTVRVRESYRGVIVAGGGDGSAVPLLIRSTDFGDTWMSISPPGMVLDVDFAGDQAETLIAASHSHIYRSDDGGIEWQSVYFSPELYRIPEVVYDAENGRVFAIYESIPSPGNQSFLIYSLDDGMNWNEISIENSGPIVDIELSEARDGSVYFAARDAGVFRFSIDTAVEEQGLNPDHSSNFMLYPNFPNPFNLSTKIRYTLPRPLHIRLTVVDIQGRTVKVLVDTHQSAGIHETVWDGTDVSGTQVPAGLYFYRLYTGPLGAETKKMVVKK